MRRSDMIGTGAYASGRPFISVWTMVDGHPDCLVPALPLASTPVETLATTIAVNRAIASIAALAEQVEAAALLAAQEPPPATVLSAGPGPDYAPLSVPNPARAQWEAAVALLADAGADADLQHLLRTRRAELNQDPWGQPTEGPWSLSLPPVPPFEPFTQTATWDGVAWFIRHLTDDEGVSWPIQVPPVPAVVSRTQLRLVLAEMAPPEGSGAGTMLDVVDAAVAGSGDRVLQERWAAERMERHSPYLVGMATGLLGLDSGGIDAIFRQAAAT